MARTLKPRRQTGKSVEGRAPVRVPWTSRILAPLSPGHRRIRSPLRGYLPRDGRIYWPTLAFLLGFAVLIYLVSVWYLLPALDAARGADPVEKKTLAAHARLLLAVVLVVLVCGIVLTFRFGRFFLPRQREQRLRTQYPDAWAESAKRVQVPPDDPG
jgi:hypothetical protein